MRPQVPEQKDNLIFGGKDFDYFLYEDMARFLERNIGTEEFWKHNEDEQVMSLVRDLNTMKAHCTRVIEKLQLALRIRKAVETPRYVPIPGDEFFVPSVPAESNIQEVAVSGGIATVLEVSDDGKVRFYGFPEIPFRTSHLMKNQMKWMDEYGMVAAKRIEEEEAPVLSESDDRLSDDESLDDLEEIPDHDGSSDDEDEDEGV